MSEGFRVRVGQAFQTAPQVAGALFESDGLRLNLGQSRFADRQVGGHLNECRGEGTHDSRGGTATWRGGR